MAKRLICPQGHEWEVTSEQHPLDVLQGIVCPRCGAAAETQPPTASALGKSPEPTVAISGPRDAPPPECLAPARHDLPGYELLGELGRGGMGIVYKARQVALNRVVALKMIRGGLMAGPEELARFRAEAEAVARLRHPNIVHVYDVGGGDEAPFFSLEYVEGGSLDRKLAGRPQPPREAAAVVEALARAVHAAHAQGIVHRDLKPGNVLLTADGTPKVTDFGLAKCLEGQTSQTQTGAILGTPSYMAPEQARGDRRAVGPAADVHALGAILYEMLTGRPPFRAGTVLETLEKVCTTEPAPPRQLQPKVPKDLETVCLKCLEKEPHRRYASAADLGEDLRRFLEHEPVRARPLGRLERLGRWVRRRREAVLVAGCALLAAGAALAAVYVLRSPEGPAPPPVLQALAPAPPKTKHYPGHLAPVFTAVLSADGKRLLTGAGGAFDKNGQLVPGPDCTVRLWDVRTGKELKQFVGHTDLVTTVSFAGEGGRILSAGKDSTIREWDEATGKEIRRFGIAHALLSPVGGVAFSPDGRWALSFIGDKLLLYDVSKRGIVRHLTGHTGRVTTAAFAPDSRRALSGGQDTRLRLWDVETGRQIREFSGHALPVGFVTLSPDGRRALSADAPRGLPDEPGPTVRLWDVETGTELYRVDVPGWVTTLAISPDGERFAYGEFLPPRVRIVDWPRGQEVHKLEGHSAVLTRLTFTPDGLSLFSASQDTTVRHWDVRTGREIARFGDSARYLQIVQNARAGTVAQGQGLREGPEVGPTDETVRVFTGHANYVYAVAFDPKGRYFLSGGGGEHSPDGSFLPGKDCSLRLWDAGAGKKVRRLTGHTHAVITAVFSADGKYILSGSWDGTVRLWLTDTGAEVRCYRGHQGGVTGVAISPDGGLAVSGSWDRTARVWSVRTGQELVRFPGHQAQVEVVALSPDAELALSGDQGSTILLWEVKTGKQRRAFRGHDGKVTGLVFTPDGKRFLSTGYDGMVRLWDVQAGEPVRTFRGHAGYAWGVALSPDGRRAVSVGEDQLVHVWDTEAGKEIGRFRGHTGHLNSVAVSPDGRLALTGSFDHTMRLWQIDSTAADIRERLQETTDHWVKADPGQRFTLRAALEVVAKVHRLTAEIDRNAVGAGAKEQAEEIEARPVSFFALRGVRVGTVLRVLAEQARLRYVVRGNKLLLIAAPPGLPADEGGDASLTKVLDGPPGRLVGLKQQRCRLSELLDYLNHACRLNVVVGQRFFREVSPDDADLRGQEVTVPAPDNLSLGRLLQKMLEPVGARYVLRRDHILIIPRTLESNDAAR